MVVGYALYCAIDGRMAPAGLLVTEFLMGALVGALAGALAANIRPRRARRSTRARRSLGFRMRPEHTRKRGERGGLLKILTVTCAEAMRCGWKRRRGA